MIEKFWEWPCIFSANGCLKVGDHATMKEHSPVCSLRNIECPYWKCPKKVHLQNVTDHMMNVHSAVVWPDSECRFGQIQGVNYMLPISNYNNRNVKAQLVLTPVVAAFDGQTFIANGVIKDGRWFLWVSIVASEKESQHYEVTISAEARGSCAKVTCSVYSVDLGRMNLPEDGEGVLELSRSMAKRLGMIEDGNFKVEIDYEIRRKYILY